MFWVGSAFCISFSYIVLWITSQIILYKFDATTFSIRLCWIGMRLMSMNQNVLWNLMRRYSNISNLNYWWTKPNDIIFILKHRCKQKVRDFLDLFTVSFIKGDDVKDPAYEPSSQETSSQQSQNSSIPNDEYEGEIKSSYHCQTKFSA